MTNYKIIKRYDSFFERDRYYAYRKYFGFIWMKIAAKSELEDAIAFIQSYKEERQNKKKPNEFIGYY